jgi:hypothetical protein
MFGPVSESEPEIDIFDANHNILCDVYDKLMIQKELRAAAKKKALIALAVLRVIDDDDDETYMGMHEVATKACHYANKMLAKRKKLEQALVHACNMAGYKNKEEEEEEEEEEEMPELVEEE